MRLRLKVPALLTSSSLATYGQKKNCKGRRVPLLMPPVFPYREVLDSSWEGNLLLRRTSSSGIVPKMIFLTRLVELHFTFLSYYTLARADIRSAYHSHSHSHSIPFVRSKVLRSQYLFASIFSALFFAKCSFLMSRKSRKQRTAIISLQSSTSIHISQGEC